MFKSTAIYSIILLYQAVELTLGVFAVQNVFDGGHKVRCKIDTATQTASMHAIIKDPVPHVALHASAKMDKSGIPSLGLSAKLTPPLAW